MAAIALTAGGLVACAPSSSGDPAASTVRVGIAGGSTGTVLDPHLFSDALGTWFGWAFYESIGELDADNVYHDVLAESFTPNDDATSWTLVLKEGITFHSGKPLSADDVIFSFDRVLDPATAATSAASASVIQEMTKIDDRTVRFDLSAPRGAFNEIVSESGTMSIVPTDFDISRPDSTGPWAFESYEPGVEIRMTRFDGYHGTPAKLDSLSILGFPDDDARINALLSGQIDIDTTLLPTSLPQLRNNPGFQVLQMPAGGFQVVTMRVDQGPTADPRVREALRLAVDRDQIITVVDGGNARPGNDVYGIDDPGYRDDLVRTRDLARARQLIVDAGAQGTPLTLYTISGIEPMAQVVAQNAREIGLDVTVELRDDATFYSDGYLEYDVAVDQWPAVSFLTVASLADGPEASLPYTRFSDPEFDALLAEGLATTDAAERNRVVGQMQQILFDRGAFIIPRFADQLVGTRAGLTGLAEADPFAGVLLMRSLTDVSWAP